MDGASPNVVWQHGSATPAERAAALGRAGCTIWMTGLSGSGKSTIALAAERALLAAGLPALVLDGDNLRHGLSAGIGFDEAGRAEAVRRAGEAALLVAASGAVAIVSLVSPYEADRARVRARHEASGVAFAVVHVDAPLAVAEARDPKGALPPSACGRDRTIHRRERSVRGARVARPSPGHRCRIDRVVRGLGRCARAAPGPSCVSRPAQSRGYPAAMAFAARLEQLRSDITAQGERVLGCCSLATECYFEHDQAKARAVIAADDAIDKADVEIERASIPLLQMGNSDEYQVRSVLTIVKVNNELERIADCAVNIAEQVAGQARMDERIPPTFRVMANSVLGMLRDANRALITGNPDLARQVLLFDDTVDRFKNEILLHAQEQVALGQFSVRFAFQLTSVTRSVERIADHCTNICEQVIYVETGKIVRHRPEGWSEPERPQP